MQVENYFFYIKYSLELADIESNFAYESISVAPCVQLYSVLRISFGLNPRALDFVSLPAEIFHIVEHFVVRFHKIVNMMKISTAINEYKQKNWKNKYK